MRAVAAAFVLLLSCAEEPVPEPSPLKLADAAARDLYTSTSEAPHDGAVTEAPSTAAPSTLAPATSAPPVTPGAEAAPAPDVKLSWDQISTLHRSFFSDPVLKRALATALAPSVRGVPEVEIGYDAVTVRGRIELKVPPGGLALTVGQSGDRIQLQDLRPITVALDAYRLAMGSRYDLRLLNFRVRIEVRGGGRTCGFGPAGDPPPDGTVISPCVTVGGQPECGQASREGVQFAPAVASAVRACLGLAGG